MTDIFFFDFLTQNLNGRGPVLSRVRLAPWGMLYCGVEILEAQEEVLGRIVVERVGLAVLGVGEGVFAGVGELLAEAAGDLDPARRRSRARSGRS